MENNVPTSDLISKQAVIDAILEANVTVIERCPICGKEPRIKYKKRTGVFSKEPHRVDIYCRSHSRPWKYHHRVSVEKYVVTKPNQTAMLAIEDWNRDARKIRRCMKVIESLTGNDSKTAYLLGDRGYTQKQLTSFLQGSGKDIEFI